MLLIVIADNLQRCQGCRARAGIIDPPMGKRLCPEDGETCLSHAQGLIPCKLGLLVADDGKPPAEAKPAPAKGGPGTELKMLLAKVGFKASPSCRCNAMAIQMDANSPSWSLENVDAIVDVMRSEAARRSLPFVSAAARMMVRRAVRKAKCNPSSVAAGASR